MVLLKGKLPKDRKDLEKIPFMGQYLANAVDLLVFKKTSPLMDVNMARVLERYFGPRKLADIRYDPYLQNLCAWVTRHKKSKYISWAILDFAEIICQARSPRCEICLFNKTCQYALQIQQINEA
jgi:A/G-specific adenine glycosylase